MNRRRLLWGFVCSILFFLPVFIIGRKRNLNGHRRFVRPPGALPEKDFKKQCIGCFKCATACPNNCIKMASFEHGFENVHTPVIVPREKGCTLCMRCTEVCPTGALREISREMPIIANKVKMGVAVLDPDLCFSFHGRTCGVCYRACPLPGKAMKVDIFEQPTVFADKCVGCGLCEQACIHMPQAIRIRPA